MISRRGIIGVLSGLIAAPTIVKATSLMPVKTVNEAWINSPRLVYSNLTVGDVVTFGSDAPPGDQRQFLVTHVEGNNASIYPPRGNGEWSADQSDLKPVPRPSLNNLLTIDQITREAVQLFKNSNLFLRNMDRQYDAAFAAAFAAEGARIGDTLRIQLPSDYVMRDGPTRLEYNALYDGMLPKATPAPSPTLSAPAAIALGAAAVVAANPVVSRRFWK